jgi:hypothetical protein
MVLLVVALAVGIGLGVGLKVKSTSSKTLPSKITTSNLMEHLQVSL